MKKIIATFISLVIMSMAALPAAAQTRTRAINRNVYQSRSTYRNAVRYNRDRRTDNYRYRNDDYRYRNDDYRYRNDDYRYGDDGWYEDDRSVWEKHRDKITTAAGAGGGAAIGGMLGGKKGAIIGAIAGGASAAIYTYKIRDKNRRY